MWFGLFFALMIAATAAVFLLLLASGAMFLYLGWTLGPWYGILTTLMVVCGMAPTVARMIQRPPAQEASPED